MTGDRRALKIHEVTREDGALSPVSLVARARALSIAFDDAELPLADGALEAVMKRFGGPLETREVVMEVGRLDLGDGCALRHVRHLARYDVIAKDFLVYERPGEDAVCALAVTVSGALTHLARAGAGA